jgi:hypothetical protein
LVRARLLWIGAVGLTACSLLVETGDLAGVADPPDAAREVGAPDVTVDGASTSSSSGSPPLDAGVDAAPRVCNATFCDDFDIPPLGAKWDSTTVSSSGSLTLGAGGLSAPNALVIDLNGFSTRRAFLERSFPTIPNALRCSVSVNLEIPPPGVGADLEFLSFTASGSGAPRVFLKVVGATPPSIGYNSVVDLPDGGRDAISEVVGTVAAGTWVRVELASNGLTLQVKVGAVERSYPVIAIGELPVRVRLGESGDSDDAHVRARFDDFECTID